MRRNKAGEKRPQVVPAAQGAAGRSRAFRRGKPAVRKCVICGEEVAPNSSEDLCWVCRRLKISAWGETDGHLSARE